jgi:methylmalonyl-CoA epimerase
VVLSAIQNGQVSCVTIRRKGEIGQVLLFGLSGLEKNRPGLHHIAFNVDNVQEALDTVKENDVMLIHEKPKTGAGGLESAFIHPQTTSGVLMECCSKPEKD